MDYQKIYNQLIEKVKQENRVKKGEIYYESHHIVPKCLGGTNDKSNLVLLTAREHFLAHMLLYKIYPNNIRLFHALWMMSNINNRKNFQEGKFISSRYYESLRLIHSENLKNSWLIKRKELCLLINEDNIKLFNQEYPNIINLSENNKHCINYCLNNNILLNNIICPCNKGIKRFQNYTQGYKLYCSKKCSNFFNKEKSLITKENKGLWDNSKERIRKKEIENLSEEQIKQLKSQKISSKLKGRFVDWTGDHILQYDLQDNFIKEWPSIRQAGLEIKGTNGETIRKCLKGLQKTAYGFKWKYK